MSEMTSRKILTEKQLAAIGCAAVESTYTESLIENMIVILSGVKAERLQPFLLGKMLEGKLVILEQLAESALTSKKKKSEFATIIESVRRANTGRTSLIHGEWTITNFLRTMQTEWQPDGTAKAINKRNNKAPTVSANKAEKIAQEIADAYMALFIFHFRNFIGPRYKRAKSRSKYLQQRQNPGTNPPDGAAVF